MNYGNLGYHHRHRLHKAEFKKQLYPIIMVPGTRSQRDTTSPRLTHGKNEPFDKKKRQGRG